MKEREKINDFMNIPLPFQFLYGGRKIGIADEYVVEFLQCHLSALFLTSLFLSFFYHNNRYYY